MLYIGHFCTFSFAWDARSPHYAYFFPLDFAFEYRWTFLRPRRLTHRRARRRPPTQFIPFLLSDIPSHHLLMPRGLSLGAPSCPVRRFLFLF